MKEREEMERTTEAEAIELIQSQVAELDVLREQLQLKETELVHLRGQVQQVESYKEQILTLRRQVQICEEKIKFYDRENSMKNEQIVEKVKFASTIEKELHAEMQDLEERLGAALDASQKKSEKVGELERKMATKDKKNKEIKREIERMGERVVSLQNSQRVKDDENMKKFQKFEAQMKEMLGDKRRTQERIRVLTKQADELNRQVESAKMQEKEAQDGQRKVQRECKQLREENSRLHALLEQLSVENQSVSSLRQKATQLDQYVLSLTEQFQMQRRHFQEVKYEKEEIEGELRELQIKYLGPGRGNSSMEGLKGIIAQMERQLDEARSRLEEQNNQLREKQEAILELQNEQKQSERYVAAELGSLKIWIETYIGSSHFYEEEVEEPGSATRRTGRAKSVSPRPGGQMKKESAKRCIGGVYEEVVRKLGEALKEARRNACTKFKELGGQLDQMKKELWETNILKNEIVNDLGGFKSSIRDQESHLNSMRQENDRLRDECIQREAQIERQKQIRQEEGANNRALLLDFFHALNCVREKFQNVEYVRRQLNLKIEANAKESPTAAVSEVIALIGDITNLQSFEIKSLQVRMMELDESKQSWEQNKGELYEELERLERMKQEEVKKLEEAYNAKYAQFRSISGDLERTVKELSQEVEQTRARMVHQSQEQQMLEERVQSAQEEGERTRRMKDVMVHMAMGLVLRVEELIEGKRLLQKMLESANQRCEFQRRELVAMFERYKIEETLQAGKKEERVLSVGEKRAAEKRQKVLRVLKFRKCVIAVIAALRFRRTKHFGVSVRGISENLQEVRTKQERGRVNEEQVESENFDTLNLDLRAHSRMGSAETQQPPPHAALALRNVFKRMQFLTLPGYTRLETEEREKGMKGEAESEISEDSPAQGLEQLWRSITDFVHELRMHEASHERGSPQCLQQSLDLFSTSSLTRHTHYQQQSSELFPQHQTLLGLLAQSSLFLKHRVLESDMQPGTLAKARLRSLEKAFCGRKDYTQSVEKVEKFLHKIDAQSQEIFKTFKNIEKERGVLHERTGRLVLENKGVLQELHKTKETVEELRSERRGLVRPEAYSRLEEQYEEKIRENEGLSRRADALQEKERDLQRQVSGLLGEKKELHEQKMLLEARSRQLEREMELKEAAMGSVQQMLATRESEIQGVQQCSQSMSFEKQGLLAKLSELEHEREKLIKDNVFLISQNELFSKKIEELKAQESKVEASGQAQIREYVELVQFYNSKASKYEEITKLQETNMKALEERCKMLEFEQRQQQQVQGKGGYLPVASSYERNLRSSGTASLTHHADTVSSTMAPPTFIHEAQRNEAVLDLSKSSIPTTQSMNFESLQLPSGICAAAAGMAGQASESVEMMGGVYYEESKRKSETEAAQITPPMKERSSSSRFHFGGGMGGGDMPSEIKEESPSVEYGDKETPSCSSRTKHSFESSAKIPGKIARLKNS